MEYSFQRGSEATVAGNSYFPDYGFRYYHFVWSPDSVFRDDSYEDRTTTITNRKYTAVDQGYCPKWNKVVDADNYVEYVFKFMWSNDYRIVQVC